MKNEIIQLKGEDAKVLAEVAVSTGVGRTITIRLCQIIPSNILVVVRNNFLVSDDLWNNTFADLAVAEALFMATVSDAAL